MASTSRRRIIIALDFGTTYSGVAWALTDNPDDHYIVNQWPDTTSGPLSGLTNEKVPTEIAYEYDESGPSCLWGLQIPESMPRHQWIKLALDPTQKAGIGSRLSSMYVDRRDLSPPYHASPEDLVSGYLKCLHEHVIRVLRSKIGAALDSMTWEYVVTVPAVWSDAAKAKTQSCAEKAGLGEISKTRLISEPEAAAIHALQSSNPRSLAVGDTIVLCDAGGGTVDLITFSILELRPSLRLKEEAPGSGALCGSTFLNRRFEKLLDERFSSDPGWGRDTLEEAVYRFETVAKRTFGGETDIDFMIPVPGIDDNPDLSVCRGKMKLSGKDMVDIFQPVLQEILDLVQGQIQASSKKEGVAAGVEVIQVINGWTAVVRGALVKVLADVAPSVKPISVESRVARKHHGTIFSDVFDPERHDPNKKYFDYYSGQYKIDVMHWFINKGDQIKEGEPIETTWQEWGLTKDGVFDSITVIIYQLNTIGNTGAPMYFNRSIKKLLRLCPHLGRIPQSRIPVRTGKDGQAYYVVEYEIHAAYFSAHCEYTLWYEGEDYGTVKANYD